jgi:hypothetical protein
VIPIPVIGTFMGALVGGGCCHHQTLFTDENVHARQ